MATPAAASATADKQKALKDTEKAASGASAQVVYGMDFSDVKTDLKAEDCPKGFTPMFHAQNIRLSALSGRTYRFKSMAIVFVNNKDVDFCAGRGAAVKEVNKKAAE